MFRSAVQLLARQSGRILRSDSVIAPRVASVCSSSCQTTGCERQAKGECKNEQCTSTASQASRQMSRKVKKQPDLRYDDRFLNVTWEDGEVAVYPLVWLRYNCQCPNCFHPVSFGRRQLGRDMQTNPEIENIRVDTHDNTVHVVWDDDHQSTFSVDWLKERSFSEHRIAERDAELNDYNMRCAWGRFFQPAVLDFEKSMGSDEGLLKLITMIKVYGLVFLKNASGEQEPLNELAEKFSYTIPHNYGHFFEVKSKPDPSNLAWTSETLGLHIDNVFYNETPGIQVLHCIRQTADVEGGENQFADGMFAARRLRRVDKNAFRMLKEEKINFWDYGSDFVPKYHLRTCRPVFTVDDNDEMIEMAYNHQVQDSKMIISADKVPEWFRAMHLLENILNEEVITWRLTPGQIVIFDNLRVLHGRTGYKMTSQNSERYLRGGFLSWDETNSLYRRLNERVKQRA